MGQASLVGSQPARTVRYVWNRNERRALSKARTSEAWAPEPFAKELTSMK